MLKQRVMAKLLITGNTCVQSRGFGAYTPLGRPDIAVAYLDAWGADELVCLHIDHAGRGDAAYLDAVRRYAAGCHVPLAVGGGMGSEEQIHGALSNGADKVVVNSLLHMRPGVITAAAKRFGCQSLIVSVDVQNENGRYVVYSHGGRVRSAMPLEDVVLLAADCGAGELMICHMEREGRSCGYDSALLEKVRSLTALPVIASGGYSSPADVLACFNAGMSGVAIGNALHHAEHSLAVIKSCLAERGANIRNDGPVRYVPELVDGSGRPAKLSEETLLQLRFRKNVPVSI
jgi:cyclase